jgi:hypothetical protein
MWINQPQPVYDRLYKHDDFEALVYILSESEGGRVAPVFNGIRWDLCYARDDSENGLYMIWPDFFGESKKSWPSNEPLPVGEAISGRFLIVNDKMRHVHQKLLAVGTEFFCHEGPKRVARGTVSKITGLRDDEAKTRRAGSHRPN